MSRSHDARRFRLSLAATAHLYPVSDARLDALAENPQWADHHDVHDLVGELTARRLRRGPPATPPSARPAAPEDVRRDPRVGDTVYRAGSQGAQPFARVAAVLDGYVVVEVPDGRPLVWTVAHWGFQGVAGDRYEHVAVEDAPSPPPTSRTKGFLGQRSDAHAAWEAYKAARKTLRRRRADKAAAHERVLNFGQHRNDAAYVQDALDRSEGAVYAGRPRYNRNYRHLPTPDDAPAAPYEAPAPPTSAPTETLAAVWPSR